MVDERVCVVAPLSCSYDRFCDNGETSYLEILKTMVYLENNKHYLNSYPFDFEKPYTIGGHSTGARAAMMIGGLVDSYRIKNNGATKRKYLEGKTAGKGLT